MLLNTLAPGQTLAILHIPKTAGTSLVAQLGQAGAPWAHILNTRYVPELQRTIGDARDHLTELKPQINAGNFKFIFGHMTRRDVIFSLNGASNVRFAAVVRDPVSRFVSEYTYATSERHPDYAAVRERYPSLDAFVEACVDNNVLTHYLERYRGQPVPDIVEDVRRDFCFLGFAERIDVQVGELLSIIASNPISPQRLNVAETAASPSEATVRRIRELNARDEAFYRLLVEAGFDSP